MKRKIIILVVLFASFLLTACGVQQGHVLEDELGLSTIQSYDELKAKISQQVNPYNYFFGGFRNGLLEGDGVIFAAAEDSQTEPTSAEKSEYTTTNVQVEGVDEGDIVKADESRIYSISNNKLKVVDVSNGTMSIALFEEIFPKEEDRYYYYNQYFTDLYVTDEYLVVIYNDYGSFIQNGVAETDSFYRIYQNATGVIIYDKETLTVQNQFTMSGYQFASRLIDDQLYIIMSHYIYGYEEYDFRPWIEEDGTKEFIDVEEIKYLPSTQYQAFTIIATIKLDEEPDLETDVLLGPNSYVQVYVNHNAIYLSTYQYEITLLGEYKWTNLLISYVFNEDGSVFYGGSGTYKGSIVDQFCMDEYNGYMRIVTTDGWGEDAINRLYIFERQIIENQYYLITVGLLDQNLGKPGEKVKSVRFDEDQATVVTYQQTDPLYVIDLSDPTHPAIVGQLEIPGFSTYQHPWKEGFVIGIGFEAVGNITTGIKLSLFDITDPQNPAEVGTSLVLPYGTSGYRYAEALYNHKAIMSDPDNNMIGFTLNSWGYWYYQTISEYVLFSVDETREQPIQIAHTVDHSEYVELPDVTDYEYYWYNSTEINRAVRIGDYLYVISGTIMTSHLLSEEFSTIQVLHFDSSATN